MKNKMELLQAAQKFAADSLETVLPLEIAKAKVAAFEALNINANHYVEFVNFVDQARAAFQAMVTQPVQPTAAAPTAPTA